MSSRVAPVVGPFSLADHRLPASNPAGLASKNAIIAKPSCFGLTGLMQPCHRPSRGAGPAILRTTRKAGEIQNLLGVRHRQTFQENYLNDFLDEGWLARTSPDKPQSRLQRYHTTRKEEPGCKRRRRPHAHQVRQPSLAPQPLLLDRNH
jgi:hypothetical protein